MQLASARYLEGIGGVCLLNAQADIGHNLSEKAVAQITRGYKLAVLSRKGRVINHKVHSKCGLVYFNKGQRLNAVCGTGGLAYFKVGYSRNLNYIAYRRAFFFNPL